MLRVNDKWLERFPRSRLARNSHAMTAPSDTPSPDRSRRPRPGTLALGGAALIALAAVGVAIVRSRAPDAPPANSQAAAGPAGNVGDMITQLEAKLKGNTTDANGWRLLGWSYFETGRYAESAGAYRTAATIDPTRAEYWSALGEATVLAGKSGISAPAAEAFRKALAIDPKDPRARYFVGVKKDIDGDHKGAVDDWIALLKDTPAGAPWEADVRQLVARVAADHKIDVAGRVPAPAAPPASSPSSAAAVATNGIPGPTREQMMAASQLPAGQQDAMVRGMVDGLARRLATNPRDADGWIRLMRAHMVLGEQAAARGALASARAAFAGDAAQQARFGEAAKTLGVPGA